jgi:hypothetical protein
VVGITTSVLLLKSQQDVGNGQEQRSPNGANVGENKGHKGDDGVIGIIAKKHNGTI